MYIQNLTDLAVVRERDSSRSSRCHTNALRISKQDHHRTSGVLALSNWFLESHALSRFRRGRDRSLYLRGEGSVRRRGPSTSMQPNDVGFRTLRTVSSSTLCSIQSPTVSTYVAGPAIPRIGKTKLTKLSGSYVTHLSE